MSSADHLLKDLQGIAGELETVLTQLAGKAGEQLTASVGEAQSRVTRLRERVQDLIGELENTLRRTGQAADRSVRRHPWETIGLAAAAAFVVGILLGRRE